jgi:hypothetical protein
MLLTVSVTSAYSLLDALRIPWQVEIDHQRTELKVHSLGGGFGCNQNVAVISELFYESGPKVNGLIAGNDCLSKVPGAPGLIYFT